MKTLAFLTIFALFFVGCESSSSEPVNNPPVPEKDNADLAWISIDATIVQPAEPGDTISITVKIKNLFDPAHPDDADVKVDTKLKIYMENINADPMTIGSFGSEDLVLGEEKIHPILADNEFVNVLTYTIPTANIFPTTVPPGNTFSQDPDQVTCQIFGVLDADNSVKERDENNNLGEATINKVVGDLTIVNPNKPNLQIKYYPGTSTVTIPATGGTVDTEWEIFNDGSRAITSDFDVTLYLSEDDILDSHDPQIVEFRVTDDFSSYSSKVIKIPVTMPYETWRTNGWALYSALEKYDPQVGDVKMTRELPPQGPTGYDFKVYPIIGSTSKLIAFVDSKQTGEIEETNENDNYSYMFAGSNGELKADVSSSGSMDIELLEVDATNYHTAKNVYTIILKYNASINIAEQCSIGFYWSKDDVAQFGDYFCQRFWFQIQPGQNVVMYPFGVNFVWRAEPLPAAGMYRMVVVMDDIFKFNESDENNNWKASLADVKVD